MANYLPCIWCGEAVDLDKDHYCRKFPKEITMLPPKYIYVITMLNVLRDELRDATPIGFSLDLKKAKKDILTNENDMWKMNIIFYNYAVIEKVNIHTYAEINPGEIVGWFKSKSMRPTNSDEMLDNFIEIECPDILEKYNNFWQGYKL